MDTNTHVFFSHARAGLANKIEGAPTNNRGVVTLNIRVNNADQQKSFQLLGRDDITGFSQEKILRRVPEDGANVFAPYNLAFVEFYEEDFPWRFSPFKAEAQKLKPWLFLIALKKNEFTILEGTDASDPTLRHLQFTAGVGAPIDKLQDEIHLWAHVQTANPGNQIVKDPDGTISRILCPRKLEPDTAYEAFLIPTYEPTASLPENHLIFHSWRFQTNNEPDFEYLASLLEPRTMPVEFGRRALNCDEIGYGLEAPALARYIPMEGALTSFSVKPALHPVLQTEQNKVHKMLAAEVNKGLSDKNALDNGDMDPVVSPWAYGYRHVLYDKAINPDEKTDKPWIHLLNTAPGFRAAAGLGAQVIRANQDKYMERAWAQLESLDLVARSIHRTQAAMVISRCLYEKHILPQGDSIHDLLSVTRPLLKKSKAGSESNITFDRMLDSSMANFKSSQILRSMGGLEDRIMGRAGILFDRGDRNTKTIQVTSHTIDIIIIDRETGAPVKEASIYYRMSAGDTPFKQSVTDNNGKCVLKVTSLPVPGIFWYVWASGYGTHKFYFAPNSNNRSTMVKIALARLTQNNRGLQISGRVFVVVNGVKSSLKGVKVSVFIFALKEGRLNETVYSTDLDNNGQFMVKGNSDLLGNRVKLVFELGGFQTQELVVPWGANELMVEMKPVATIPDYKVTVVVTDRETGQPLNGISISYPRLGVEPFGLNFTKADGSCEISLTNVPLAEVYWYANGRGYCWEKFSFVPDGSLSSQKIYVSLVRYQSPPQGNKNPVNAISGEVLGAGPSVLYPLSDVSVSVYRFEFDGVVEKEIKEYYTSTNTKGEFNIEFYSRFPGNKAKLVFQRNGFENVEVIVPWGQTNLKIKMIPELNIEQNLYIKQEILHQMHPVRNHKQRLKNLFKNTAIQDWYDPEKTDEEKLLVPLAYPVFDDAMYEKVKELGTDYLVPNLKLMPNNCITLLNTNRAFVEAFLAGLNVEMGRELRWREFPTDERGSYFRQFWDVRGLMNDPALDAQEFKDIKPMDQWVSGELRDHLPEGNYSGGEPLVLAIRGGLIQAFPNAMIYAVKAVAGVGGVEIDFNGTPKGLILGDEIISPIFGGKIEPDITLKGFNLKYDIACGTGDSKNLGYFFIIKEVAGELRFGLDDFPPPPTPPQTVEKWSDLSWLNINNLNENSYFLKVFVNNEPNKPNVPNVMNLNSELKNDWGANSAKMAQIFSQKPVMIAIHAREMLKDIKKTQ
jgi:hypothetical protein